MRSFPNQFEITVLEESMLLKDVSNIEKELKSKHQTFITAILVESDIEKIVTYWFSLYRIYEQRICWEGGIIDARFEALADGRLSYWSNSWSYSSVKAIRDMIYAGFIYPTEEQCRLEELKKQMQYPFAH